MKIDFIEIRNFRRLSAVRVNFASHQTLLVGANNSGKTSAMTALRYFLIDQNKFKLNDIPLDLWPCIDHLGRLMKNSLEDSTPYDWGDILPSLDVWLSVSDNEIHRVAHLIPTLDWRPDNGIGVRLQMEPKKVEDLNKAYLTSQNAACDTLQAAKANTNKKTQSTCKDFSLWPTSMTDFLKRGLSKHFAIKAYILDSAKKENPFKGVAQPQSIPDGAVAYEGNPFKGLIQVNEVAAQRGFSDEPSAQDDDRIARPQRLSEQLQRYYTKHLDPEKTPDPSDVHALEAIREAQQVFDDRLKKKFNSPLGELENLGYPGITNPRIAIETHLKPMDGLNHSSALQYEVAPMGKPGTTYKLPEHSNGLGYQNLISMAFRLISFRDDRMRVGKLALDPSLEETGKLAPPPLHLVLVEEPEAHLHAQVQQVFIRKAYSFLRNHPDLGSNETLSTQLLVSTHSSHIAHEVDFANLRYFRRHSAQEIGGTPYSTVVNLTEVFGGEDETAKFVSRYLRADHADIFFADGVIFIEGTAERLLIPHFIRSKYEQLRRCYLTQLEVGGSHSHLFVPLIEKLGLNALIITDLDSVDGSTKKKVAPARNQKQITSNHYLKTYHSKSIDALIKAEEGDKERAYDDLSSIRVAYQTPVMAAIDEKSDLVKLIPRTFEDAFVYENIDRLKNTNGIGLVKKINTALNECTSSDEISAKLLEALKTGDKGAFALDMLYSQDPSQIQVPDYIHEGLEWLQSRLRLLQTDFPVQTESSDEVPSGK